MKRRVHCLDNAQIGLAGDGLFHLEAGRAALEWSTRKRTLPGHASDPTVGCGSWLVLAEAKRRSASPGQCFGMTPEEVRLDVAEADEFCWSSVSLLGACP